MTFLIHYLYFSWWILVLLKWIKEGYNVSTEKLEIFMKHDSNL